MARSHRFPWILAGCLYAFSIGSFGQSAPLATVPFPTAPQASDPASLKSSTSKNATSKTLTRTIQGFPVSMPQGGWAFDTIEIETKRAPKEFGDDGNTWLEPLDVIKADPNANTTRLALAYVHDEQHQRHGLIMGDFARPYVLTLHQNPTPALYLYTIQQQRLLQRTLSLEDMQQDVNDLAKDIRRVIVLNAQQHPAGRTTWTTTWSEETKVWVASQHDEAPYPMFQSWEQDPNGLYRLTTLILRRRAALNEVDSWDDRTMMQQAIQTFLLN